MASDILSDKGISSLAPKLSIICLNSISDVGGIKVIPQYASPFSGREVL